MASCDEIQQAHACELSGGKSERGHLLLLSLHPAVRVALRPDRLAVRLRQSGREQADALQWGRFVHAQLLRRPLLPVRPDRPSLRAGPAALRVVYPLLGAAGPLCAGVGGHVGPRSRLLPPHRQGLPRAGRSPGPAWTSAATASGCFSPTWRRRTGARASTTSRAWRQAADGGGPKLHPAQARPPGLRRLSGLRRQRDYLDADRGRRGCAARRPTRLKISVSRTRGHPLVAGLAGRKDRRPQPDPPEASRRSGGRNAMPGQASRCWPPPASGRRGPRYAEDHHHHAAQSADAPQAGPGRQPGHALGRRATGDDRDLAALARPARTSQTAAQEDNVLSDTRGRRLLQSHPGGRRQRQAVLGHLEARRAQRDPDVTYSRGEHESHAAVVRVLAALVGRQAVQRVRPQRRPTGSPWTSRCSTPLPAATCRPAARQAQFRSVFFCKSGAATYNVPGIQDLLFRVRHKPRQRPPSSRSR